MKMRNQHQRWNVDVTAIQLSLLAKTTIDIRNPRASSQYWNLNTRDLENHRSRKAPRVYLSERRRWTESIPDYGRMLCIASIWLWSPSLKFNISVNVLLAVATLASCYWPDVVLTPFERVNHSRLSLSSKLLCACLMSWSRYWVFRFIAKRREGKNHILIKEL